MSVEILAPAGSMESVVFAVRSAADAVYLGGKEFSARAGAKNFSDEELFEAVNYCHMHGVKVHRAINTVFFDSEVKSLVKALEYSAQIGIDALIVQDMGVCKIAHDLIPEMPLHASTQMTVYSVMGALEAKEAGLSRVVLARELPLEKIKEISDTGIETEVFVHGALCMCLSGQCYMSAMIGSRSANRGRCAQCCRLPFSVKGSKNPYSLSLKDLSYVNDTDKLIKAGVSSFKIEGRMKRAEYVSAACSALRDAVNGNKPDTKTLDAVFSRSGFTDGYLYGKRNCDMFGYRTKENVLSAESVLPVIREKNRAEKVSHNVDFSFSALHNENIKLNASCEGISVSAEGNIPEKAENKATTKEFVSDKLSKLGGTAFKADKIQISLDKCISVSASEINGMRRNAVKMLEDEIIRINTPVYSINKFCDSPKRYKKYEKSKTRIHINNIDNIDKILSFADYAAVPYECCFDIKDDTYKDRIYVCPPVFTLDEEHIYEKLSLLRDNGFDKLICNNISHIYMGKSLGYKMTGGFRLNCTNSYSMEKYSLMGVDEMIISYETKISDIKRLSHECNVSMIVYGRLPLMVTVNCPIRASVGCKNCTGKITDRTGRTFPVVCDKQRKEYSQILNSDILYMKDKLDNVNIYCEDYLIYDEDLKKIKDVVKSNESPKENFTRGLYFRGVQ